MKKIIALILLFIFMGVDIASANTLKGMTTAEYEAYIQQKYQGVTFSQKEIPKPIATDVNKDSIFSYITDSQNGYEQEKYTKTYEETLKEWECDCTFEVTEKGFTENFSMKAHSVMDGELDDYSNNGYFTKVINPFNHDLKDLKVNSFGEKFWPGNLEIQHWWSLNMDNLNTNIKSLTSFFRIPLALDYPAKAGMTFEITFPFDIEKEKVSMAGSENIFFVPGVKNNYPNVISENSVTLEQTGNIVKITFNEDIPAKSRFAMQLSKTFTAQDGFSIIKEEDPNDPTKPIFKIHPDFKYATQHVYSEVKWEWNATEMQKILDEKKNEAKNNSATDEEIAKIELEYIKWSGSPKEITKTKKTCTCPPPKTDEPKQPDNPTPPQEPKPETPTTSWPGGGGGGGGWTGWTPTNSIIPNLPINPIPIDTPTIPENSEKNGNNFQMTFIDNPKTEESTEIIAGDMFQKYPKRLPRTGGSIVLHEDKKVFRLAWSNDTNLDFWKQVLPEKDKNRGSYIVIPSVGVVVPFDQINESDTMAQSFLNGNEEDFYEYLNEGAIELPGSNHIQYGQKWNKVIGSHSSFWKSSPARYKTQFQKIIKLPVWSEIWIYKKIDGEYKRYTYKTIASYETKETDISVLKQTEASTLTLFTCTPIGTSTNRWIIRAEFVQ